MTNPPLKPPRGRPPSKVAPKVIPLATSVTTDAQQEVTEELTEMLHQGQKPVEAVPSTGHPAEARIELQTEQKPPKTPKAGKTNVIDAELRRIAENMSPQYVEGILKYLFSQHPILPPFLVWNIPDSASGFAVRVDRLIHSPTYIKNIQPGLCQIFADGFHHCNQAVAGAMVNFAVFDVLKKG